MRMVQEIRESVVAMAGTVEDLKAKIEVLQNNEADVFDPNGDLLPKQISGAEDTAQEGDGVEE